jgi:hypothetical protein
MIKLALITAPTSKYGNPLYAEMLRLSQIEGTDIVCESLNLFEESSDAPANYLLGMMRDASAQIAYELDELLDEVMLTPKCDSCSPRVKCALHFRDGRQGCIETEFRTLFIDESLFVANRSH